LKNVNTLRVKGDQTLLLVDQNSLIQIQSSDLKYIWGSVILFVLVVVFIVYKFKQSLWIVRAVLNELDQVETTIGHQVRLIEPKIEDCLLVITGHAKQSTSIIEAQFQEVINERKKLNQVLIEEWQKMKDDSKAKDLEIKLLSERLKRLLDLADPAKISSVEVTNPY
jgi:hypothetical protein